MTTRKILINNQYLRISKEIENKLDKVVFKSIEDYDFID